MKIKRLALKNFGIYAGESSFDFEGEKPVVLIGGMNGRGKTTFLNAILLSLYGQNAFCYRESKYQSYGQYLKTLVNTSDGTNLTSIELQFTLDQKSGEEYRVQRSWNGSLQKIREEIQVYKNGEYSPFLTDNWAMYVESILPEGLSSFFFFDGEKIAELAVDDSNVQLKDAIKSLLGINVIDTLQKDLKRIERKAGRASMTSTEQKKLDSLEKALKKANADLASMDDKIVAVQEKLQEIRKSLDEENATYKKNGGGIAEQQHEVFENRGAVRKEIENNKQNLIDCASGALPLYLVKDLIHSINFQATQEQKTQLNREAVQLVQSLFGTYDASDKDRKSVEKFLGFMDSEMAKNQADSIYELSPQSVLQTKILDDSLLDEEFKRAMHLIDDRKKKEAKADELENYLSVAIDEQEVNRSFKRIKELEGKNEVLIAKLQQLNEDRQTLHGVQMKATSEHKSYVEKILTKLENADDNARLMTYTGMAERVFDEYRVRLQKRKLNVLAATMTDCYKKLANKTSLIDCVTIDEHDLDFSYLDKDGEPINKYSLSAGEKQLMVISILWGLAICSKRKLPVIIDTPLSRMDSAHRSAIITNYFPQAGEQTIILSTDSEINHTYYELMKPSIGDEYTLDYSNETKSTTIKKGYLFGE